MAVCFKGAHVPTEFLLTCVRWSVADPLSTRHLEARMRERGVSVDHAPVNHWVVTYRPSLEEAFHRRKRPGWRSWRLDETDRRVKGHWSSLDRAVDQTGQTIDSLLTAHRDERAATRFLTKAIRRPGVPETITIDGREAHAAAIRRSNAAHGTAIVIRQVTYLHQILAQDHRAVKRLTRPTLWCIREPSIRI